MLLVIDSNEYIFSFGPQQDMMAVKLLNRIVDAAHLHSIRIPRTIFEEVKRNISTEAFHEFNGFINTITQVEEDIVVPFEIVFKYEAVGFKPADAFIAAYAEWVGAEILVSENRHFLRHHSDLPFKVLTAEKSLKLL